MKNKQIFALFIIAFLIVLTVLYRVFFFQDLEYMPSTEPLINPLMGWAPWATIEKSQQPHTLVYADLTWRDLEPREGQFDFTAFETRNQLARWRMEGKRVVFRFVMDVPSDEPHMDLPDWLFEKIGGSGDFYDLEYGRGFSPDYADPVLIDFHRKAIQILGEKYGGDDFFAYIELGSLGHWGEWHVRSETNIRQLPKEAVRDQYVRHYREAFPNTYLLLRRPFNIAAKEYLGLYNDMTGDSEATREWLEWIAKGGSFSQTDEQSALSAMPQGWQKAPIGGEQTRSMSDEEIYDSNLNQTLELQRASHTTFVGPGGPYEIAQDDPLQVGIDQVLAGMGYRIRISKAHLPVRVFFGSRAKIEVEMMNEGIAPFYYPWPVKIMLLDETGAEAAAAFLDLDLRQLLPNSPVKVRVSLPLEGLDNGDYTIAAAILDPLTLQPAVKFSTLTPGAELMQILGQIRLDKWF